MHDKILTLIFEYFAISSKSMSFFVPERAHYLGYMSLGEFFPCFSKLLLKMVNITNFDLAYRVGQSFPYAVINRVLSPLNLVARVQEVATRHLQACFHQNTGLELDGIWAILADSVFKVKICDIDHFEERIGGAWEELSQAHVSKIVRSFRDKERHLRISIFEYQR